MNFYLEESLYVYLQEVLKPLLIDNIADKHKKSKFLQLIMYNSRDLSSSLSSLFSLSSLSSRFSPAFLSSVSTGRWRVVDDLSVTASTG